MGSGEVGDLRHRAGTPDRHRVGQGVAELLGELPGDGGHVGRVGPDGRQGAVLAGGGQHQRQPALERAGQAAADRRHVVDGAGTAPPVGAVEDDDVDAVRPGQVGAEPSGALHQGLRVVAGAGAQQVVEQLAAHPVLGLEARAQAQHAAAR